MLPILLLLIAGAALYGSSKSEKTDPQALADFEMLSKKWIDPGFSTGSFTTAETPLFDMPPSDLAVNASLVALNIEDGSHLREALKTRPDAKPTAFYVHPDGTRALLNVIGVVVYPPWREITRTGGTRLRDAAKAKS